LQPQEAQDASARDLSSLYLHHVHVVACESLVIVGYSMVDEAEWAMGSLSGNPHKVVDLAHVLRV
jgi:hypothetical protein